MRILTALALAASAVVASKDSTGSSGSVVHREKPSVPKRSPIQFEGRHEQKYRERCGKIGAACGKVIGAVGSSAGTVVEGHLGTRLGVVKRIKLHAEIGGEEGALEGRRIGGKWGAMYGKWKDQRKIKAKKYST
ncbi:hypothetical protein AC1031_011598 [Aphanomyces cochlioides]|nr:hypothetical protein AC1031_011598 [Aphanomyces cochlioides]